MEISGRVHNFDKKERLLSIINNGNLEYFHLSNKYLKDFKPFLEIKPYVIFEASEIYSMHSNINCQDIEYFISVYQDSIEEDTREIFYDLGIIQDGVKDFINQKHNRMFLDLEFSLVSYPGKSTSEIIQYGIVLEDVDGNIIFQDSSLVKPMYKTSLNKLTLSFLSLNYEDFDDACPYIEFYQLLEKLINDYDPKIFAWGRNDWLSIEKSFKLNHLQPLEIRSRYINLMQVIKNYYNYKQEMGLFNTYKEMTGLEIEEQTHDALEDAMVEREIFNIFKKEINKKKGKKK